jgi:hypothetical protein
VEQYAPQFGEYHWSVGLGLRYLRFACGKKTGGYDAQFNLIGATGWERQCYGGVDTDW